MAKRKTQKQFIIDAETKHHDENGIPLYDYSEVEYKNTNTPVWLTHISCGNRFQQTPKVHLHGYGCTDPKCIDIRKKKTFKQNYGTNHPLQHKEIQSKLKKTNISRIGVDNPSKFHLIPILIFLDSYEWLFNQYITQQKTTQIIANELSCITSVNRGTISNYLKKHNIPSRNNNQRGSKEEIFVMIELMLMFNIIIIQHEKTGGQYSIGKYKADGYCKELNLIIEYHGSPFHGNPRKYQPNDKCHPKNKNITAKELQEKDAIREAKLISLGYNVFVIWDDEWKSDKENVILRLKAFIEEIKLITN